MTIGASSIPPRSCPTEPRAPNVALCGGFFEGRGTSLTISFSMTRMPPATEDISLAAGCTNVTLTWPEQTVAGLVARAVTPVGALEAMWWYWVGEGRFVGYAPNVPDDANDYSATVTSLDAVFICMSGPGTLTRPVR